MISFEIRDIRVTSPDWRGKFVVQMQPVSRQEGTAVWSLDPAGFRELLHFCQGDTRCNVLQAPKMTVRVGDPAKMTSEETVQYVASLKRLADGPPNQSTRLAFEPQIDRVHNGVRVKVLSSQLKDKNLFARVVIDENRLVAMHTVKYTEVVQPKPGVDAEVTKASLPGSAEPEPRTSRGGHQRHDPNTRGGQPAHRRGMADSQRRGTAGQSWAASPAREGLSKGVRGASDRHHRAVRLPSQLRQPLRQPAPVSSAEAPLNPPGQRDIISSTGVSNRVQARYLSSLPDEAIPRPAPRRPHPRREEADPSDAALDG